MEVTNKPAPSTPGTFPSATTSPPTSATSTTGTSSRWSTSATTARCASSTGASSRLCPTRRRTCWPARGSSAATASPSSYRRLPRRQRSSSAPGSSGRCCSRCPCSTATTASGTGSQDSEPRVLVTDADNAPRFEESGVELLILGRRHVRRRLRGLRDRRHRGRRSRAALLHVGHDRHGEGHRPRSPLSPRPPGVHLLPRGRGRRALPRHGRVGMGGGHRAPAWPVAPGRRSMRVPARGRIRPAQAARLPEPQRGDQRVHDADGDARDDGGGRQRARRTRSASGASARPASRSTPRRSAGSATSTGSPSSTTTG